MVQEILSDQIHALQKEIEEISEELDRIDGTASPQIIHLKRLLTARTIELDGKKIIAGFYQDQRAEGE